MVRRVDSYEAAAMNYAYPVDTQRTKQMNQPWASPRVPVWKKTKLGFSCEWGILEVALFEDQSGWTICFYLRHGVQIGRLDSFRRITKTNTPGALQEDAAKAWALSEADDWLSTENVSRILALKEDDLPAEPHVPCLPYKLKIGR